MAKSTVNIWIILGILLVIVVGAILIGLFIYWLFNNDSGDNPTPPPQPDQTVSYLLPVQVEAPTSLVGIGGNYLVNGMTCTPATDDKAVGWVFASGTGALPVTMSILNAGTGNCTDVYSTNVAIAEEILFWWNLKVDENYYTFYPGCRIQFSGDFLIPITYDVPSDIDVNTQWLSITVNSVTSHTTVDIVTNTSPSKIAEIPDLSIPPSTSDFNGLML